MAVISFEGHVVKGIVDRFSGIYDSCLRAFDFDGDCVDRVGGNDGTPTAVTYADGKLGALDQAANFNGSTSLVNIGSDADIDDLSEFTVIAAIYPRSDGEGNEGKIYSKGTGIRFEVRNENSGAVQLYAQVACATVNAVALTDAIDGLVTLGGWTVVAMTWSDSSKLVRIFQLNDQGEAEEFEYDTQTAGQGAQSTDAASSGCVGNYATGTNTFDGLIDTFRLYNVPLPASLIGFFLETPIYFTKAPQKERGEVTYPYVVLYEISDVPEWMWDTGRIEQMRAQFSIVTDSDDEMSGEQRCLVINHGIQVCFDHHQIDPGDGWRSICMWRDGGGGPRRSSDEVTEQMCDYLVKTSRMGPGYGYGGYGMGGYGS